MLQEGLALQVKHTFMQALSAQRRMAELHVASETAKENHELSERAYREELIEADQMFEALMIETLTRARRHRANYEITMARLQLDLIIGSKMAEYLGPGEATR